MRLLWIDSTQEPLCPGPAGHVVYAGSADEAVSLMRHDSFDLVVVNTASLSEEGFICIKRLRLAAYTTPLIAVTAQCAAENIRALGLGADDAISWPVHTDKLQARMMAVARRARSHARSDIECGNISLCLASQEVRVGSILLRLTGMEYRVLELLTLKKETCVSKNMILAHLYKGMDDEPDGKIVDVFICKLRRKLEHASANWMIGTVWGQGYILRAGNRAFESTKPHSLLNLVGSNLTHASSGMWLQ